MQKGVEAKAGAPCQQRRLRPLVEEVARVVAQRGGKADLNELTEAVLCRGKDGDTLRYATGFIGFLAGLKVRENAGLQVPRGGIVCDQSRDIEEQLLIRRPVAIASRSGISAAASAAQRAIGTTACR